MEDINSIVMPDLGAKKPKKEKVVKTVLVEKEQLSRVNREITCNYCESLKTLNPDQYQNLFDIHGSEEKLQSEFMCKVCEMNMKRNPFEFWTYHGEPYHTLCKNLKTAFDLYRNSARTVAEGTALQNMSAGFLRECKIVDPNYEFVIENQLPIGVLIKNVPFVGSVILKVYEQRKTRIGIQR